MTTRTSLTSSVRYCPVFLPSITAMQIVFAVYYTRTQRLDPDRSLMRVLSRDYSLPTRWFSSEQNSRLKLQGSSPRRQDDDAKRGGSEAHFFPMSADDRGSAGGKGSGWGERGTGGRGLESVGETVSGVNYLIYRPDRRYEAWRFLTYMFVHVGWLHLLLNIVIQLSVGLPLELVHGSIRVAILYVSGVLAGSLSTSVLDATTCLAGASAGVYALLAGHAADVCLHFSQIELRKLKVTIICMVATADVLFALWDNNSNLNHSTASPFSSAPLPHSDTARLVFTPALIRSPQINSTVSYVAHLAGALSGFIQGLFILRDNDQHKLANDSELRFRSTDCGKTSQNYCAHLPASTQLFGLGSNCSPLERYEKVKRTVWLSGSFRTQTWFILGLYVCWIFFAVAWNVVNI